MNISDNIKKITDDYIDNEMFFSNHGQTHYDPKC